MSILIKGMDKPTSCADCELAEHYERYELENYCPFMGWYADYEKCPLVPIPPHGDLIDRDALLSQYKGNIWTAQTDYAEGLRDVAKDIADAPAIIQAERGETHEPPES